MSKVNIVIESMSKNKKVLGLVALMSPVELMKTLIQKMDLLPKEAAKVVYDLKKKSEGIATGPISGIESNKMFPVPASMKSDDKVDEFEESNGKDLWGGPRPDDDGKGKFPPPPRPTPDSFPYDKVFTNYMNNPKRKKPITSSKKPKLKNPLDIDLRNQPGGDGAGGKGIYHKTVHSKDNDTPSQGRSWSTRGKPGWSSSLKDKEFEVPPKSIKKAEPVENRPKNAGDVENGSLFMNEPNVAQTIWTPGRQKNRSSPYRGYRRR